jgi:hypothetical protein
VAKKAPLHDPERVCAPPRMAVDGVPLGDALVGTVVRASIPWPDEGRDCVDVLEVDARIHLSADYPGKYELHFVHPDGSPQMTLAKPEVVRMLMAESTLAVAEHSGSIVEALSRMAHSCLPPPTAAGLPAEACLEEAPCEIIETGQSLCSDGVVHLGCVTLSCDGTVAGQLWTAGAALGGWLLDGNLPAGKPVVVEVGSGTGAAGLAAAAAGASQVVLTDRPAAVPRLTQSIARNAPMLRALDTVAVAAPLEWGDVGMARACCPDGCDVVLACDCLYTPEAMVHEALMSTFVALAGPRGGLILHAYEVRWDEIRQVWRKGLERRRDLVLVRETELERPSPVNGRVASGRVVLEELRAVTPDMG